MKIVLLIVGILLSIPSMGLANGMAPFSQQEQPGVSHRDGHHGHYQMNDQHWKKKMQEREQQILSWVSKYAPEKKQEWQKVMNEGNSLRDKWLSPEFATKREQWKKNKLAQMQALKKAYDDGKITKEEFFAKVHGGKKIAGWKTYHSLKTAVENNDTEQAKAQLDKLLSYYKTHNEKLKSMIQASK